MDSDPAGTRRILIAEDDDIQGAVLQRVLNGRGYAADIVTDGLEAVRRLRTGRYDLALLDYRIPEVDGFAAARLLRDLMPDIQCPRLIAVTSAAEELCGKQDNGGERTFNAVVSKRLGLPALLNVIDANLTLAADEKAAAREARGRAALRETRGRYLRAPLAALPALGMAGLFVVGIGGLLASLQHVDGVRGAAARNETLTTNAAAMLGAVQDAEASQRTYLATGAEAQRKNFETDAQRVDWLLVSREPLSADGAPGFGENTEPQSVIMNRMRALSDEARQRRAAAPGAPLPLAEPAAGRDAIEWLRGWAADLVVGSRRAVFSGLDAIRHNVEFVLAVLGVGTVYGLWNAGGAMRRRWRMLGPTLGTLEPAMPGPMPIAMEPAATAAPRLLHEWD